MSWYPKVNEGDQNAGTDIHHLRPLIYNINSARNNSKYGEVPNRESYRRTFTGTVDKIEMTNVDYGYLNGTLGVDPKFNNKGVFEPLDNVKGDVARIIMYMLVRYKDNVASGYPVTNIIYTPSGLTTDAMALLLRWNTSDPVDQYEITRNEEAYKIQGNRNPFIDYPNYANMIWGN